MMIKLSISSKKIFFFTRNKIQKKWTFIKGKQQERDEKGKKINENGKWEMVMGNIKYIKFGSVLDAILIIEETGRLL